MGLYYPFIQTIRWVNTMAENGNKLISIKRKTLTVYIIAVSITIISMVVMLVNDRYVVINKSDLNTKNIADLTMVVDKMLSKIETHVKAGGHDVMIERNSTVEADFKEIKADIKEILRRTPR